MGRRVNNKWRDELYIEIYDLAREGLSNLAIAEILDISYGTLKKWIKTKAALKTAISKARSEKDDNRPATVEEYIYQQLSPDLQKLWASLNEFEHEGNTLRKMELLRDQPDKTRQMIFIHALVTSARFDTSRACKAAGITKAVYDKWTLTDPTFMQLIEEVLWHKKNFFEGALAGLVASGDTSAILFVNKTINRDRGYDQRHKIELSGSVLHGTINIDALPLEERRRLLEQAKRNRLEQEEPEIKYLNAPPVGEIIEMGDK